MPPSLLIGYCCYNIFCENLAWAVNTYIPYTRVLGNSLGLGFSKTLSTIETIILKF
jgi:hypothetical protein